MSKETGSSIDLFWLPLGAGGHSVRLNGRIFEAVVAPLQGRPRCDLYHSALVVHVPEGRVVIEQTPVPDSTGGERGVVAEGAVGSRSAGRFRIFRYEVRRWRDGVIPDADEAVDSPRRLTDDPRLARRVLELVPSVPTATWGRDELDAGEMWNSNSIVSWLIARSGLDADSIQPPTGGRAPGWDAGLVVARRQTAPDFVERDRVRGRAWVERARTRARATQLNRQSWEEYETWTAPRLAVTAEGMVPRRSVDKLSSAADIREKHSRT